MFSWRIKMHALKLLGMLLDYDGNSLCKIADLRTRLGLILVNGFPKYLTGSKGARERSSDCAIHTYNLKNRLSFPCWKLCKCCCTMCKLIWKQLQASNEEHLWWDMLPAINLSLWFLSLILLKGKRNRLSFPCWNLCKCCCSMCKVMWKQLQASNEDHLWWGMLSAKKFWFP